jgi:hypothetical protein
MKNSNQQQESKIYYTDERVFLNLETLIIPSKHWPQNANYHKKKSENENPSSLANENPYDWN